MSFSNEFVDCSLAKVSFQKDDDDEDEEKPAPKKRAPRKKVRVTKVLIQP